jgi:hypothetical protein
MLIAAKQIRAAGQVSSLNPTLAAITNKWTAASSFSGAQWNKL